MRAFAGTAYIKVDGEQMAVTSDAITVPFNTVTRETVVGATGVVGFSETERVPYVSGTFYVTKDFPMEKIQTKTQAAGAKVEKLVEIFEADPGE